MYLGFVSSYNTGKFLKKDPKDWNSFYKGADLDKPINDMISLVTDLYLKAGFEIVFCTGRPESIFNITLTWLYKYFPCMSREYISSHLIMREDSDYRADHKTKPAQLKKHGVDINSIFMALEDRDSMVAKWRELGVRCLQVREGNY